MDELKMKFMEVYSVLKAELLQDSAFEFTPDSLKWIDQMLDYNVPKGKLSRGLCVICSYKALREGQEIKDEEIFLACVLGWCIEWHQAHALVHDDIVDNSYLRRGQPCWYRKPEVGMIALNDGLILLNHVFRILKKHFKEKTYYVDLLDLFNEVVFQTSSGQMIDLITAAEGEEDLTKYTMLVYNRIVEFKSAYYSFYLPVACAMILAGENIENHIKDKDIFVQLGTYFQIENDYMDCFGDPKVTGVVGTDIEDRKCSWLVVKALECANEEQKKLLCENYGNTDPACVAKVKKLYESLDLQGMYANFEKQALEKLARSVETHPSKAVQALWQVCVRRLR